MSRVCCELFTKVCHYWFCSTEAHVSQFANRRRRLSCVRLLSGGSCSLQLVMEFKRRRRRRSNRLERRIGLCRFANMICHFPVFNKEICLIAYNMRFLAGRNKLLLINLPTLAIFSSTICDSFAKLLPLEEHTRWRFNGEGDDDGGRDMLKTIPRQSDWMVDG